MYTPLPKFLSGCISSLQTLKKGRIISLLFTGVLLGCAMGSNAQVTSYPYNEGWEGGGFGSWTQATSDDFDWENNSGGTTSGSTGPSSANQGSQYVYTETSFPINSGDVAIIENDFDLTNVSNPQIIFDYHMYFAGSPDGGTLELDVSTNGGSTWTNLWSKSGDQGNQWNNGTVPLTGYTNSTIKLRFRFEVGTNTSFENDCAIDDVTINQGPSCPAPTSLTASNVKSNSVQLSWQSFDPGSNWEVAYGASGFTLGNGNRTFANTNPYNLSGLGANTNYDVYVREICGPNDTSSFAGPVTFTTPCLAKTLPYTQDFSGGNFPGCWTRSNSSEVTVEGSCGSRSDVLNITEEEQVVTVDIDASSVKTLKVSYIFGGGECINDPESDENIQVDYWNGSSWVQAKEYFGDPSYFNDSFYVPQSELSSSFKLRLDMRDGTIDAFQFDDFVIEKGPACLAPTNSDVTVGFETAKFSWKQPFALSKNYIVEYGQAGFTQGNGASASTSNTSFEVDTLKPSTSYEYYLASICGSDTSSFVGPFSFETDCAPFQAPLVQDFESASGTTPPTCWTNVDDEGNENWEFEDGTSRTPDDSDGDHTLGPGNGGVMAFLDGSDDADSTILESPWVDMSNFDKEAMAFWLWSETESGSKEDFPIRIDVVTQDNINYGVESYDVENSGWERFVVDLSSFNDTVKIRFNGRDLDGGFYKDPAIDDVRFGPLDDLETRAVVGPEQNCNLTANEAITAAFENKGIDTIKAGTSLDVGYQLKNSSLVTEAVTLNEDLPPNDTFNYQFGTKADLSAGDTVYKFDLISTWSEDALDGNDELRDSFVRFRKSEIISSTGDSICFGGSGTIKATSSSDPTGLDADNITWLSTNMNKIGNGDSLTTGPLTKDTSFLVYAKDFRVLDTGAKNFNTTSGGMPVVGAGRGLEFDVFQTIIIDSLTVYADNSGTLNIEVVDAESNVVGSANPSVQGLGETNGETISIDIEVPPGEDYKILAQGTDVDLYYDFLPNAPGNATYPFKNSYFSVTNNFGSGIPAPGFYIFFYGWHISKPTCQSDVKTVDVAVQPNPSAGFESPNVVCAVDSVAFKDTSDFSGVGNLNYQWDLGGQASSTQADPDYAFPNSTGSYSVEQVVQSDFGCVDTAVQTVDVNARPEPAIADIEACAGKQTQLRDSTRFPGFGDLNYQWTVQNSTYQSVNPVHTFSASATNEVELAVTSDKGCTDTVTQQADILPTPDVQYSVSDACAGDQVQFNDNTAFGGSVSNLNYNWSFGDRAGSSNPSATHTYDTLGDYNTRLIVRSADGCADTANRQVTINGLPDPDFTFENTCDPKAVDLTNTTKFGGDAANLDYTWDLEGNSVNVEEATYTFSNAQTYQVELQATNTNGNCVNTITQDVDVKPQPTADFSVSDVCVGEEANFDYTGNNPAPSYSWDLATTTSTMENPAVTYNQPGSYDVSLTVNYYDGECVKDTTQTVAVNPVPTADFAFGTEGAVCAGEEVQFVNNTTFENGNANTLNYDWAVGSTGLSGESPVFPFDNEGTFDVELTARSTEGCESTFSLTKVVNPLPVSDFTLEKVGPDEVSLSAQNNTYLDYTYTLDDSAKVTQPSVNYTFDSNGTYNITLMVEDRAGCTSSTSDTFTIETVGFGDQPEATSSKIEAYPNPFQDVARINYSVEQQADVQLEVYTANGQNLVTENYNDRPAGSYSFNLKADRSLPTGATYLIRLQIGDKVYTKELIQQR